MKRNKKIAARMGTLLLLICMLLNLAIPARAAEHNNDLDLPQNMRVGYSVGCANRLEGDVFVLAIFLDDEVSNWTQEEIDNFHETQLIPSLEFVENNAAEWDVDLTIHASYHASCSSPDRPAVYSGIIEDFQNGVISEDILEEAAYAMGFSSAYEMHMELKEFVDMDQIAYLLMVDRPGISYSMNYTRFQGSDWTGEDELEYSVVFSSYPNYSNPEYNTPVAHEFLHLFGAEDYYYPDNRAALARRYYPDDIMLGDKIALKNNTMDDYTAYTLGWTDTVPPVCQNPDWWDNCDDYS